MRKIGFIGAYDKIDFIIYLAKIGVVLGKKVLVIDSTINQKAKYIVPKINPTKSYVTTYENIDVAVGFENYQEIKQYLGIPDGVDLEYDIAFIDCDNTSSLSGFELQAAEKNYFVTSFDLFSLNRGLEILSGLTTPMTLTKILFSKMMTKEEDDYLNFLALGYKVVWNNEKIYLPFESGDQSAIMENQRIAKVKFKNLSVPYKESLMYLAEEIFKDVKSSNVKKAVKQIEKGV